MFFFQKKSLTGWYVYCIKFLSISSSFLICLMKRDKTYLTPIIFSIKGTVLRSLFIWGCQQKALGGASRAQKREWSKRKKQRIKSLISKHTANSYIFYWYHIYSFYKIFKVQAFNSSNIWKYGIEYVFV